MNWPWVSRELFNLVSEQCIHLLEEKRMLLHKIEHMERAMLRASPTPEAQEYIRRIEPKPFDPDPKPTEPGAGSPWEAWVQYYSDKEIWEYRHKEQIS